MSNTPSRLTPDLSGSFPSRERPFQPKSGENFTIYLGLTSFPFGGSRLEEAEKTDSTFPHQSPFGVGVDMFLRKPTNDFFKHFLENSIPTIRQIENRFGDSVNTPKPATKNLGQTGQDIDLLVWSPETRRQLDAVFQRLAAADGIKGGTLSFTVTFKAGKILIYNAKTSGFGVQEKANRVAGALTAELTKIIGLNRKNRAVPNSGSFDYQMDFGRTRQSLGSGHSVKITPLGTDDRIWKSGWKKFEKAKSAQQQVVGSGSGGWRLRGVGDRKIWEIGSIDTGAEHPQHPPASLFQLKNRPPRRVNGDEEGYARRSLDGFRTIVDQLMFSPETQKQLDSILQRVNQKDELKRGTIALRVRFDEEGRVVIDSKIIDGFVNWNERHRLKHMIVWHLTEKIKSSVDKNRVHLRSAFISGYQIGFR